MLMKLLPAAALGLLLAACDEGPASADSAARADGSAPSGRYTVEIVAMDGGALHYVRAEDGGPAAALTTREDDPDAARLLEGRAADRALEEALAALDLPEGEPQDVQIRLFGQSFSADGDGEGEGQVRMELNLPDGRSISLNAGESGAGGDNGEAHVSMGGWDAGDVADHIDDIDDAPRALREDMKDALGL